MGEKVLIKIDSSTVHLISHLLYAIELMFSNNYLEDFTQQNLDQFIHWRNGTIRMDTFIRMV